MGERTIELWGWIVACVAFFVPMLAVLALSFLALSDAATPEILVDIRPSEKAIDLFASLTQVMITMSVGLVVAALWLFRQPLKPRYRRFQGAMLIASMLAALVTFYSGLRFLYDSGVQLTLMPFEFGLVRSRLYWEGIGLLAQLSILSFTAVVHHYYRDGRYRTGGRG
ncbi:MULTISPECIES: hypothetical protein [unclassified Sphingopyxis]|uniref:hypothetical protein n=1 Tax=unclassified Sphingopyxis TaxID=2614943 RepID=UPI00131A14D2|nr:MULTISPECIES: hypothetical protein [unclassified Sphingopyxis]